MSKRSIILFSIFIVTCVHGGVIWETPSNLQPVHGLYVKPSVDGTTGDLYVAATEDNGVNSQWLTDQPINFLASASENQQLPLSFTSTDSNEIPPQKRAVLTTPIKYAQALTTGTEENMHHVPTSGETSKPHATQCPHAAPYYSPFQYFYPQMLSAIANAYTQKEGSDDTVKAQPAAWQHAYAYPFQYVMFDPRAWANQISASDNSKASTKDGA